MKRKRSDSKSGRMLSLAAVALCFTTGGPASAQKAPEPDAKNFPERPIRLIDPYAPGGGSGVIARLVGAKLTDAWGKVIRDNNIRVE